MCIVGAIYKEKVSKISPAAFMAHNPAGEQCKDGQGIEATVRSVTSEYDACTETIIRVDVVGSDTMDLPGSLVSEV